MTVALVSGVVLSLASAAALNWGFFLQHGAAASLPPLTLRHPVRSLLALFSDARWRTGLVTGTGGWALYVGALRLAPLSIVQAVSAGGIGLLALLASRGSAAALARRERVGVALAVSGLALLGVSLAGQATGGGAASAPQAVAMWLAASAVAALVAAALGMRRLAPGAGLGLAAGILYAAGDVATKVAVGGGARLELVPVVLAFHGLAFVALQLGFQRGGVLATVGVATLFTNALPIAAGTTIFHEGLPAGPLGVVRVVAFAASALGAGALAGAGEKASRAEVGRPPSRAPVPSTPETGVAGRKHVWARLGLGRGGVATLDHRANG